MAKKKLRCFIAMAFGRTDTDQMYENCIKTTLRRNNVIPVIINRRQNNDDINIQIIQQLQAANFCIADLTYARPSVYFEAGYVQRAVEVIYTVRKDHLANNKPDHEQVHFDLKMKPLLLWTSPTDKQFEKNLERRLKATVLKDFAIKISQEKKNTKAEHGFIAMSVKVRLKKLRLRSIDLLKKHGYKNWKMYAPSNLPWLSRIDDKIKLSKMINYDIYFTSSIIEKTNVQVVSTRAVQKLSSRQLKEEEACFYTSDYDDLPGFKKGKHEARQHHLILMLDKISPSRIMSALPQYKYDRDSDSFFLKVTTTKDDFTLNRKINIHFISGIKSIPEFIERFKKITIKWRNQK